MSINECSTIIVGGQRDGDIEFGKRTIYSIQGAGEGSGFMANPAMGEEIINLNRSWFRLPKKVKHRDESCW